MREVYRHHEFIRVNYFRELLEAEGIPTMLRNEHLVHGVVEIPIPEFYPNLCVLHDEDYAKAWGMIRSALEAEAESNEPEVICAGCGEVNPGNFGECFSCQKSLF